MCSPESRAAAPSVTDEARHRFGVLPNFFRPAPGFEGIAAGLWAFARAAYLDNPLPSLFKERLFVHLSRFCEARYCVVRHACFLAGQGHPAGDPDSPVETVDGIVRLLRRPVPSDLEASLRRLEGIAGPADPPAADTGFEADLFDVLTVVFLEAHRSERARAAIRTALGDGTADRVFTLLTYVRAAHYWTAIHPDLELEPDAVAFLAEHDELAKLLDDPSDAAAVGPTGAYLQAVRELRLVRDSLATSEERYRWLFESMDTGFTLVERVADADGAEDYRIVAVNPAQGRLTGLALAEGQSARALLPAAGDELITSLAQVITTGRPVEFEIHQESVDRWFDVHLSRVGGDERQTVTIVFRDISERVRSTAEQVQRERSQREFVANAAHELRTPLTAMIAAIDTLDGGAIDDPVARGRFFGHVRREAARLSRLCDSLLLLADLESRPRPPRSVVAVRPLLEDIAAALTPRPGVAVVVDVPDGLSLVTNHGLVERILTNLADNSAKYTASGRITLTAHRSGETTVIEVRDTGEGLGLSSAQAIQRFTRGGQRTTDGFGLGLAIAHQAAVAIGADLRLDNAPDGGTVARLVLPPAPPTTIRVLVISDDDTTRAMITDPLGRDRYSVVEATSGQDGLDQARLRSFDLVLVDLGLTDMPGIEVIRRISTIGITVPRVLAITGRTDEPTRAAATAAGADYVLTTPFTADQLTASARSLTGDAV